MIQVLQTLKTIFIDSEESVYLSSLRDFLFTLAILLSNASVKFEKFITQLQHLYPLDLYLSFLKYLLSRSNLSSSRLAILSALEMVIKHEEFLDEDTETVKLIADVGMLDPAPIVRLKAVSFLLSNIADHNMILPLKMQLRIASIKARDLDESVRKIAMTHLVELGAASVVDVLNHEEVIVMTKLLLKTISCVQPHNIDFDSYVLQLGKLITPKIKFFIRSYQYFCHY